MLVESVNVAKPVTIEFNDQAVQTGIFKSTVAGAIEVSSLGLAGDTIVDKQVHGGLDQAVYLYHKEDYDWWSEQLGRTLDYGTFGENLTLSGVSDIAWVIGDRLKINNIELEITAPRTPCFKLGVRMQDPTFVKKFAKAIRPGAYARVITPGVLQAGDSVLVEKTTADFAAVKEVFAVWHSKDRPAAFLAKALASPIASVHKQKLQEWYDASTQ